MARRHWVLLALLLIGGATLHTPTLHRLEVTNESGRKITGLEVRARRGHALIGGLENGETTNVWFLDKKEAGYVFSETVGGQQVELGRCWYSWGLSPIESVEVRIGRHGVDHLSCREQE